MATLGEYLMAQILSPLDRRLKRYAKEHNLRQDIVELDYLLSWLLAAIAADPHLANRLIFKGGTALKKCYFENYRFSEDLDFTALDGAPSGENLTQLMQAVTKRAETFMNVHAPVLLSCELYTEKKPHPDGQVAFKVRAQLPGQHEPLTSAMIEISFTERLIYAPQLCQISHLYGESIEQHVQVYGCKEIILEKLRGILQHTKKLHEKGWTRSRTRDYYDLYRLLHHDKNLFSDKEMAVYLGLKCHSKKVGFNSVDDFFDPLFIKDVRKDWKQHLGYLVYDLPFVDVVLNDVRDAIKRLLSYQPTLSQLLGFTEFHSLLKGRDLVEYCIFRLRYGANPNDEENNGHRALTIALQRGLREVALLLIEHGADMKIRDKSGLNAFEWALSRELYDVAYQIYKKGYPYIPRHPNQALKVPHQNLYKFEMQYFS